jgi:hypothetical protein
MDPVRSCIATFQPWAFLLLQHARDLDALLQDMTLEASCTVETRDCTHIGEIQQQLAENGVKLYGGQWPAALS